jgi:hypothetical protein
MSRGRVVTDDGMGKLRAIWGKVRAREEFYRERDKERERDRCTVCGQRYEWFQLDGSGRGPECQP